MMKLRINPIVAEDLKNIKEYIVENNEEMAVKILRKIYTPIESLKQFPYMKLKITFINIVLGKQLSPYNAREHCV